MSRKSKLEMEIERDAGDDLSRGLQGATKVTRFRSPVMRVSQNKEPR